ncbi:MAG: DUF1598 domain-containing protein, partial [Pirellulaceae bacterium]|nr:DUF1598 domain-containing protein [Pirellulaceae bacterium]
MSRTYVSHFLCALVVLSLPLVAGADDNIRAQLEAGEFGPALEAAKSLPGGARDRWLGQVAAAQAAAGAVQGARSTLGSMADDSARYDAVSGIRSAPVGERWGRGGAAMADFDTLIELITSTISPESWEDVGGAGAIEEFPGGVYVDPKGLLKKRTFTDETGELKELRGAASGDSGNRNVRRESPLRKVSLNRLEKQLQLNAAFGDGTAESLEALAGIYKIQYVFVYPETGDVVIAGPAGDWKSSPEGRRVHAKTGKPTLHLDDLVVMLRAARGKDKHFGCSITPLRENLANAKRYLEESAKKSLRPGQRGKWLADLRDHMGRQKIDVFGIDARTHASHVLVEADYRMKLVGMGLEEGTLGVKSYLDAVKLDKDGNPPAMSVLRWWFTPNYSALRTTPDRNAFELRGQGVKVLSENEMLTERG